MNPNPGNLGNTAQNERATKASRRGAPFQHLPKAKTSTISEKLINRRESRDEFFSSRLFFCSRWPLRRSSSSGNKSVSITNCKEDWSGVFGSENPMRNLYVNQIKISRCGRLCPKADPRHRYNQDWPIKGGTGGVTGGRQIPCRQRPNS